MATVNKSSRIELLFLSLESFWSDEIAEAVRDFNSWSSDQRLLFAADRVPEVERLLEELIELMADFPIKQQYYDRFAKLEMKVKENYTLLANIINQ